MRWRIAALTLAVVAVAGAGGWYVATHRSTSSPRPAVPAAAAQRPALLATLDPVAPVPERHRLARRISTATADPAFGGSLDGVIADGVSGRVIYSHGAGTPMPPASTAKLLTAVAALEKLGPDATLATGVVRSHHDLIVVGGGDVTLARKAASGYPASATLTELARRTAAALTAPGPYRVEYDDTAWAGPTRAPGWNSDYFTEGDVSHLSPLEVDEARQSKSPYVPRAADPSAQAATAFAAALQKAGVRITGAVRPAVARPSELGVASVYSPPVAALVQQMLTNSDNDLAEALGREVATKSGLTPSFAGAARAVVGEMRHLGVPTSGVRMVDCSGLSRLDRIPPRTLLAVLRLATGQLPELQAVVAGLPVAGTSGTLADRYRHPPASDGAGVVRAKTGNLAGVNTLAGTVVDADGRLLLFVFMTDRAVDSTATEHALDRLAARLAGCGCGGVTT